MILYTIGQSNKAFVTLTEGVTISNPFFLLELISKSTRAVVKTFVTDLSSYTERYNEFDLTMTLTEGDYIYNFYQKANQDNEDTDGALLLETGLLRVRGIEAATIYYEPS